MKRKKKSKKNLWYHSNHNKSSMDCQGIQAQVKHVTTHGLIDNINTFGKLFLKNLEKLDDVNITQKLRCKDSLHIT